MTPTILWLGFVLGLRHALDADHLAAVAAIVSERRSVHGSSRVGLFWGIGHTMMLLGTGILLLAFEIDIPPSVALLVEFAVALILVFMGFRLLLRLMHGGRIHHHPHVHGEFVHSHPHLHQMRDKPNAHMHSLLSRLNLQQAGNSTSLMLGMLHGLAGSAGLMLLLAATINDMSSGLAYIALFGLGSIGGMWVMSMLIGIPFLHRGKHQHRVHQFVQLTAGFSGILVGIFLGVEAGVKIGIL